MDKGGLLTAERLREILDYDPETGVFAWKEHQTGRRFDKPVGYPILGYLKVVINWQVYALHRLAWLYMTGRWPEDEIDHINGQKSDNRFANLREADRCINNQNLQAPPNRVGMVLWGLRQENTISGKHGLKQRANIFTWGASVHQNMPTRPTLRLNENYMRGAQFEGYLLIQQT